MSPATRNQYEIVVAPKDGGYYAELWWRPFSGWLVASTAKRSNKGWAQRDGSRVFGPFISAQNRKADR